MIEARKGKDVSINATERVVVRVQGKQWRFEPSGGVAVWEGKYSADLNYYGDRPITGKVWVGKTEHVITITP